MSDQKTIVEEQMRQLLERWEAQADPRAIFLGCYRLMTQNMLQAINQTEFADPSWVDRLLQHFAEYYFKALQAYDKGDVHTPAAWKIAFEYASDDDFSVIQHLLLGVNAHINYDLVFAAADLLESEWPNLTPEMRSQRQADHKKVNTIIQRTIDEVQDTIIERRDPRLELLDRFMGPLDEWLISRLLSYWRDEVWEQTVTYLDTHGNETRQEFRKAREAHVTRLAHTILFL